MPKFSLKLEGLTAIDSLLLKARVRKLSIRRLASSTEVLLLGFKASSMYCIERITLLLLWAALAKVTPN